MSPLKQFANQLVSPALSSQEILDSLRILGFRASTQGIKEVLAVASSLEKYFHKLETNFPNAKRFLEDFKRAKEILELLKSTKDIPESDSKQPRFHSTSFCSVIARQSLSDIDFDQYPALAELVTFLWCVNSQIHAWQDIRPSYNLHKLLGHSIRFIENLKYLVEDSPEQARVSSLSFTANPAKWIKQSAELFLLQQNLLDSEYLYESLVEACDLINKEVLLAPRSGKLDVAPNITTQLGASLKERQRLVIHHSAFREDELKQLAKVLRASLNLSAISISASCPEATPQYFFEALIVAVALATGRSIRGAIEFPLHEESWESIAIIKNPSRYGKHISPFWCKNLTEHTTLKLALPEILQCLSESPIRYHEATTLGECLPNSYSDWEDRCFQWLGQHLKGSRYSLDRKIRDALTHALYQGTANSALLKWITTPEDKLKYQVESLADYLNPISTRTVDAYSDACVKLFGSYGVKETIRYLFVKNFKSFANEELKSILNSKVNNSGPKPTVPQIFLGDVKNSENSNDLIAYHNALARYLLMLLIVATGHRRSKSPFFFPWDILTKEKLAFICDKSIDGSEARFVPIPDWLSNMVGEYHKHLQELAHHLSVKNVHLAVEIRNLLSGNMMTREKKESKRDNQSERNLPVFGQFFLIRGDYSARSIRTSDLDEICKHAECEGVGYFRKRISNALWANGLSGFQIEAFLGHNAEHHCFGESSAWTILEWAETIRPAQEKYLAEDGWQSIAIKISAKYLKNNIAILPEFEKSRFGYEKRSIENAVARAKAQKIIQDLLPAEWFDNDNSKITDSDITLLKNRAAECLTGDQESTRKIGYAISKAVDQLRSRRGKAISSTIANIKRTEAGPIEITNSRQYAIAAATREWWITRLGNYSSDTKESYIDRLAEIGISLVIFDAIFDKGNWRLVINSIARHEIQSAHGCLLVSGKIEKSSRAYDKTIVLSPYSAAQVTGFQNLYSNDLYDQKAENSVFKRIEKWLKGAPHRIESLTFLKLISIFKAWWILRMAGCEYAIAIGDFSGPAPDLDSEKAIYDLKSPIEDTIPAIEMHLEHSDRKIGSPSYARSKINELLRDAAANFELKQQTSRMQRNRLMRYLEDSKSHKELKILANQKPVVSVMVGYLQYLLDEGGVRVDDYAFNSINTFYSHIKKLVDIWWNESMDSFEQEDYDSAYAKLLNNSSQAAFPIWSFHKYLRETYGAPNSILASDYKRTTINCRSALITSEQFWRAWKNIKILNDDGQNVLHAKTYMSIGYQYGLRSKESLGLDFDDLIQIQPKEFKIHVERNKIRDLKTKKHSLRDVQPILARNEYQSYLIKLNESHALSPSGRKSLFSDLTKKDELYSKSKITQAATSALRAATGNLSVVPHSMRHSAATRMAHMALHQPREIPLSKPVNKTLLEEVESNSIFSCFDQGFYAWPFWLDRIAMLLGHSSVDMLLNTYWHSSHIRLAERTWKASENIEVTIQQLANMLGKERTTLNKQLLKFKKMNGYDDIQLNEKLISHHVKASSIPTLDEKSENVEPDSLDILSPIEELENAEISDQWVTYDRLLRKRLIDGHSFDEIRTISKKLGVSSTKIDAFLQSYQNLITQLGFDYFEPDNSELVKANIKNSRGTLKGSKERERSLATARAQFLKSEIFAKKLQELIFHWINRVNSKSPWFVARNIHEVELHVEVLIAMGATRDQFEFAGYDFDNSQLHRVLTREEIEKILPVKARLSSGPRNARVSELGIRVKQKVNTQIGDYRDTHRLILILAAILNVQSIQS